MSDWSEGYVSDISYTHGFYRELTPSLLRFALLARGIRPPYVDRRFNYCELGFGQGFSLNLLAAANAGSGFWGTDFNPAHATEAIRLSEQASTENLHLFDYSFNALPTVDWPSFDFICLHGVWSWISRENRQAIVSFLRSHLRPGGVVYISYNALPGWAAVMPLRELLIQYGASSSEPTAVRIEKAIAFAGRLRDANAGYFTANPGLGSRLDRIRDMSRNYLAHEYFNRDWDPTYHAEVAQDLSAAKLTFAGSAHLADQIDVINFTEAARDIITGISDPVLKETMRDYFLNQQFRRDIFIRGAVPLRPREQWGELGSMRFVLAAHRADIELTARFPVGEVQLQEAVYGPLLDSLVAGPKAMTQLTEGAAKTKVQPAQVLQALMVLCAQGIVVPALSGAQDKARQKATRRFNEAVVQRSIYSSELQALASPMTGGGVPVGRFDQLFLLGWQQDPKADLAKFVWSCLAAQGEKIIKDGRTLETEDENLQELSRLAGIFNDKRLPLLKGLGIA